jgi:hypothetical protein
MVSMIGKIMVVVHFGLSVLVMALAILFYALHIDWSEGQQKGAVKVEGEMVARKARVKDQWEKWNPAWAAWKDTRSNVLDQEAYRVADTGWYDTELRHATSVATDMNPVREPEYANGVLQLVPVDKTKPLHLRPKLKDAKDDQGKPLANLEYYRKDEVAKLAALIDEVKKLNDLVEETTRLTDLLTPPQGKGLRQRIEDEKVKIKLADEELAIMRPLLINTAVESELMLRRRDMLRARIEELSRERGVVSRKE